MVSNMLTKLSELRLGDFENPAEEIADLWLEQFVDVENVTPEDLFSIALDVMQLCYTCDDTYPFSMLENRIFGKLSLNQIDEIRNMYCSSKNTAIQKIMRSPVWGK